MSTIGSNFDTAASKVLLLAGQYIRLASAHLEESGELPPDSGSASEPIALSLGIIAQALVNASRGDLGMLTDLLKLEQQQELKLKMTRPEKFVTSN